jgi:thioredoxin reductase
MADLHDVIVIGSGPIKDAAALRGADIGYVYVADPPVELQVDYASEQDGWVKITNPNPWRDTRKQGWIKKSRTAEQILGGEETWVITGKNINIRRAG